MNRILISLSFGLMLAVLARAENETVFADEDSWMDKSEEWDFVNLDGTDYFLSKKEVSFAQAVRICYDNGAQLAWIEKPTEWARLSINMLSQGLTGSYWLRKYIPGLEGTVEPTTGEPSNEKCSQSHLFGATIQFRDVDCTYHSRFICR